MEVGYKYWIRFNKPVKFKNYSTTYYYDSVYRILSFDLTTGNLVVERYKEFLRFFIIPSRCTIIINTQDITHLERY